MRNFSCVLGDWGTAHTNGVNFFGSTPVYGGPLTFGGGIKDLFSVSRLALELFFDQEGISLEINRT